MNTEQIELIKTLFAKAEEHGIMLWLQSGWAIDARLGKVMREHDDIDVAFPLEQQEAFEALLKDLGCENKESEKYGFIMHKDGVAIDCEPCVKTDKGYSFDNAPDNSCPLEKEGAIEGFEVRCVTWDYMYYEFLFFKQEVKIEDWSTKHFDSIKIIEQHISLKRRQEIEELFKQSQSVIL
jgi:aminoglycoside 2''-adenylyltransferase